MSVAMRGGTVLQKPERKMGYRDGQAWVVMVGGGYAEADSSASDAAMAIAGRKSVKYWTTSMMARSYYMNGWDAGVVDGIDGMEETEIDADGRVYRRVR